MANLLCVRKAGLAAIVACLLLVAGGESLAQGGSGGQGRGAAKKAEKAQKKVNKQGDKLSKAAEKAGRGIGRDVVFCVLAAHTTEVGTAQELKDKFEALPEEFPFGQFVAAVLMADRTDLELDFILAQLQEGKSLGEIAGDAGVDMGELKREFGQFRAELARSMTNPPTTNCFDPEE